MNNHYHDLLLEAYEQEQRETRRAAAAQIQRAFERLTMPVVKLLVHTQPYPGENLESFMYRVAERNGLRSVSEIRRVLGLPSGKPLAAKRHHQLSISLGGSFDALASIIPTELDRNVAMLGKSCLKRQHLALAASRICPICVADQGYGKLAWNLAPLAVCGEHGVYLVDQCPCSPDRQLIDTRSGYTRCSCGRDICEGPARSASPAAAQLAREIERRFFHEFTGAELSPATGLASLPPETRLNDLLDLVVLLGSLDGKSGGVGPRMARPVVRMDAVAIQFEKAAGALSCWPDGLFPLLRCALGIRHARINKMRAIDKLSALSAVVERHLPSPLYSWFLQGQADFLATPSAWVPCSAEVEKTSWGV